MKVLLANPPWLRTGWYGVRAGSRWPHLERADSPYMPFPFLMGYAAAQLEQAGCEVAVIDACAERMDRSTFLRRFAEAAPDVALMEVSTPSLPEDLRTVDEVRALGWGGDLLLAGLHKPLYDPAFLAGLPGVSATLIGEYELPLLAWVQARGGADARPNGLPASPLPGVIHRGPGDELLDGGRLPSRQELDRLPWPARHLFPMERYHDLPGGIPAPSVQLWGSRGCSFTCSFCAWPQILYADHLYRTRSADAVADEVLAMAEQGYRSVYFDDDTFNLGKRRTQDLAETFLRRGVDLPWAFMGRADTCDPAQYELLRRTGLQAVKFGVESADTARLRRIGKNLDVERVRATVRRVHELGIKVHLTFMFGLPGETLESMQRTLDLAYELDPDSAQFTIAVPFPGSRLHDELDAAGRLGALDLSDLDGYRTGVVSTDALEAEQIINFVHGVHRRWERRPRPAGPAPKIPVREIGASNLAVALVARRGEADWLRRALRAVAEQEGPARELLVFAERGDPDLEPAAAAACDHATFVDLDPGAPAAAALRDAPERCTAGWIASLCDGALPEPGWLLGLLEAVKAHPDAGAVAVAVSGAGDLHSTALQMTRWGRVLPARSPLGGPLFGVSVRGGVFSRALLEDAEGLDPRLEAELADADLALRGRLLGYETVPSAGPGLRFPGRPALVLEDGPADPEAVRRWAYGRLRLLVKSLPKESWAEVPPALLLELGMDLWRARRDGRSVSALLRGWGDGLRDREGLLAERRRTLGRRRSGPERLRAAFEAAEGDLAAHCKWQRLLREISP